MERGRAPYYSMPRPSTFWPVPLMAAVVCVSGMARAQAPDPHAAVVAEASGLAHEVWTIRDGLPLSHLNGVIQARDRYLWLASFDGLIRFDGARFAVFNTATNPELPTNRFVSIIEGPDGDVWAAAEFDYVVRWMDGAFEVHELADERRGTAIGAIQFDSTGTLWVSTNRGVYVKRGSRIEPLSDESLRPHVVATFLASDGAVWIGTDGGGALRWRDGEVQRVSAGAGPHSSLANSFAELADGTVYIGTGVAVLAWRGGSVKTLLPAGFNEIWVHALHKLGPDSVLVVTESGLFTLRNGRLGDRRPEIKAVGPGHISFLTDSRGDRWLAIEKRLYRNEELVFQGRFPIAAIAVDHEESLWIASDGLHRLKPALFHVYGTQEGALPNIYPIFEDSRGRIWLGSLSDGIALYSHGHLRVLKNLVPLPQSIFEDRAGRIWIGGINYGGCVLEGLRCERHIPFLSGHTVKAIYQDRAGAMWFGTDRGLYRDSAGVIQHFTSGNGLPHDFVRVILEARDGSLWFGTNGGGIARYRNGRFESLTANAGLSSDLVRSIHEDDHGIFWIGTEDAGLNRVQLPGGDGAVANLSEATITAIRRHDGLYDDGVHAILDDGEGRFWMSCNRGIFWVLRSDLEEFATGRIGQIHSVSYTERDGLRNREANGGVQSPAIVASDGRLWFAMQAGAAVVDPGSTHLSDVPIPVKVEEVRSEGKPLLPGGPGGSRRLKLEASQRDFEIEYTALSFLAPENLRFNYRLDGFQADWVEASNRRTAFFTNVPPGSYTFRVRATRGDGVWHNADPPLALGVAPYFYETLWFRLTVGFVVVLAALTGLRAHDVRHQRRARQLEQRVAARTATIEAQKKQLQELDSAKSRFFANVSHEFRTPLTLMIGPLEDLRAGLHGDIAPEAAREILLALRNAQRLLSLVDQLLDVARLEANRVELQAEPGDLVAFLRGLLLTFSPWAERNEITVRLDAPPDPCEVYFDPDLLEKVFANLAANALKYTPAGGAIRVSLRATVPVPGHPDFADMPDGYATVQMKDSGPGIRADDLPYVFERFYRAPGSDEAQDGTGLGLSLARELVELHGGSIEAESEEGFGATFTVRLPLGSSHFDASQLAASPSPGNSYHFSPTADLGVVTERPSSEITDHVSGLGETAADDLDSPTVLLIDDNAELRAYVAKHLHAASYRALQAATGAEGLRLARQVVPDCIVSDIMMPGLDGRALCRTLKSDPELDFVPVILLTAKAGRDHKLEGLSEGADDYITKPFAVAELAARVGNLIASRQRLRERFRQEAVLRPAPAEARSRDEVFLDRVRQVLEAHLADSNLSVESLADALSQSRSQLYRRLSDLLGQSPSEVIQHFRLERGADLLAARAGTVSEIAYGVGFKSVSHFCRRFRARYGMSPSDYTAAAASVSLRD